MTVSAVPGGASPLEWLCAVVGTAWLHAWAAPATGARVCLVLCCVLRSPDMSPLCKKVACHRLARCLLSVESRVKTLGGCMHEVNLVRKTCCSSILRRMCPMLLMLCQVHLTACSSLFTWAGCGCA